jgi:hypothetical protein
MKNKSIMELQLFLKNNLAIHFYYSKKSCNGNIIKINNLYLIFPGLPQFVDKNFFKSKVDKSVAFMYVYYYGSYFSGGSFSFANCQKTIRDAISFAKTRKGMKIYDNKQIEWSFNKIIAIGNSFGSSPILTSGITKKDVNMVIFISPLIFIHKDDINNVATKKEMIKFYDFNKIFLDFMSRGYKNIYRGIEKDIWKKYFSGNLVKSKINLKDEFPPIIIFHGDKDQIINPKSSIFFHNIYKNKVKLNIIKKQDHDFESLFKFVKR